MNLLEAPMLFFDGQTTGMRPPQGRLLELGWAVAAAGDAPPVVSSQLFGLPERHLNRKIAEITGLTAAEIEGRPEPRGWFNEVLAPVVSACGATHAVVHCAQFERPFLEDLGCPPLDFICTQQLTRRLYPDLPSQNIRAVSGYFGHTLTGPNRAGDFTLATFAIWQGLALRLKELGIHTLAELHAWQDNKATPKKKRAISYRIPAELRLNLPTQPGIYKMLGKSGEVLYVGKATSLRDRVNSYFRGVKNRDRRKLEMLAQVWDLKVEVCGSPLEAALRETDEIKRLDPRYNVSLKKNRRELCFYSRCFMRTAARQCADFPLGPFRPGGNLEMVIALHRSLESGEFEQIFFDPIDVPILEEGFRLFLESHGLSRRRLTSPRRLLAYGVHLHRQFVEPETPLEEQDTAEEEEVEVTPEYVAGKFERLLRRAGVELARARKFTAVLNSDIEFRVKDEWRKLQLRGGMYHSWPQAEFSKNIFPWAGLDIETYDRISVLLSELSRLEHRILRQFPPR